MEGNKSRRVPSQYDRWHHPASACLTSQFIITHSPFKTPTAISSRHEDQGLCGKLTTGEMDEERPRSQTVNTTASTYSENFSSTASFAYDKLFLRTAPGLLLLAEIGLWFNGSACVLYLIAAIVDATSVSEDIHQRHNYDSWTASAFFAFLVTACYAGSTYFSFQSWRTRS
ncbi:CKLF-like MARVEL transmembrane domain-containing protein 8 isoform X2 [Pelobates fuscus]|uniref:CKLF-like MARVEL transmembrane domain-containing protein 8 isoform X2 n=1 Tax=Pelobates fuscus TaxID=191477 RepID=UPI002FE42C44